MAIVRRRPINSSLRAQMYLVNPDLSDKAPERSLLAPLHKKGGRNAYGRITTRHIGGGAKRMYRIVDFKRMQRDVDGTVRALEYDPNRNVPIALVAYRNGAKAYIIAPETLRVVTLMYRFLNWPASVKKLCSIAEPI